MLVLFFTIIFLAELIITGWIISQINKARAFVGEINQEVLNIQPLLKENIEKAHKMLSELLDSLNSFTKFLSEKQGELGALVNRNIFSTVVAVVLKLPFKEILSLLEVVIKIKRILK